MREFNKAGAARPDMAAVWGKLLPAEDWSLFSGGQENNVDRKEKLPFNPSLRSSVF
jgi:hypothetical protein